MSKGYMIMNDDGTANSADPIASQNVMTLSAANTAIASLPITYAGGVQKLNVKQLTANGTITSGTLVVYMTDDGTITGNALFPNEILYTSIVTTDPSNVFGLGYVISNSNKTLTITANKQTFSGVTVVGVSVLGSVSLSAAPNGTAIGVHVIGR